MFDNQVVNLDIYSIMNSNNRDFNDIASQKLRSSHGLSVESINSGSNNSKRRQLPQIPLEKQQQNREKSKNTLLYKSQNFENDPRIRFIDSRIVLERSKNLESKNIN